MELIRVIKRVWKQLLLLILIICGLCLFQIQNSDDEKIYYYYEDMIREYEELQRNSDNEQADYTTLQYQVYRDVRKDIKNNSDREYIESAQVLFRDHVQYIYTYHDEIEHSVEHAKEVLGYSLFKDKNSYSRLNTIKCANDMLKVKNVTVATGNTTAIEKLMDYKELSLLFLLVMLIIVITFMEECNNGMNVIVRASRCGRFALAVKRSIILFLIAMVMTFVVNGAVFGIYLYRYGGTGDLLNSIQSSQMFTLFPYEMNILQFFFVYCILFALGMYGIGVLLYGIMLLIRSDKVSYVVILGIFGLEYILYNTIPYNSSWCLLKFINIFSVIMSGDSIRYVNWGYDGWVTDVTSSTFILIAALVVICTVAVLAMYSLQYAGGSYGMLKKFQDGITEASQKVLCRLNSFGMEAYKVMILQRGLLIIILFAYLLSDCVLQRGVDYSRKNEYVSQFYEIYEGQIPDEDTYAYIEKLQSKVNLMEENNNLTGIEQMQLSDMKSAVNAMRGSADYVKKVNAQKHIEAVIVNPAPYNDVLGKRMNANQESINLICVLTIILAVGGMFGYEKKYGMVVVSRTSSNRQSVWRNKALMVVLLTLMIWAIAWIFNWSNIFKLYDLKQLTAPVQSIAAYENFPLKISILAYMVLTQIIRLFMLMGVSFFVFGVSIFFNYTGAITISMLTLVPHLLYVFKIPFMNYLSVVVAVDYNRCFTEYGSNMMKYGLCFALLMSGIIMCRMSYRKWNRI